MTKPDDALLWARERTAKWAEERGFAELAESIRRGKRDRSLRDDADAYRAGAKAARKAQ
jgi:hypothetical protein